ncbi:10579_t:CDS:2 [Cetraspora pellucida]|uniref:10579_t:CDS:1 n=1 Tax=Cetraspora pellucida TaxID=1433469 RepID=A0A9N9JLW4_9GLOM|nr:10579_t:CDS:2 [Cetraspora pellucida]
MAESHWSHLHTILANSDNRDTLPTNRPYHCANYFVHRFQSLKKELYKKPNLTGFGEITNFFDRVEFQNRGAAHTHSCYWTANTIQDMIQNDVIQSTMPDPLYEPELYAAVVANQIHTCNEKCRRPNLITQTCKKGFPRPYSESTHYEEVKYLTTDPPPIRTRSILPIHMIDENDENPYYDDTIIKYMHRPCIPEFENLTYLQYFEKYFITPSHPTTTHRIIHHDELFNYVVEHMKEL